jgi:MYXO-CTERM domain-containing protein
MHQPPPPFTQCDSLAPVSASVLPTSTPPVPSSPEPVRSEPVRHSVARTSAIAVLLVSSLSAALMGFSPSEPSQRSVAAPEIKLSESGNPTRWHAPSVDITLDASLDNLGPGAKDTVRFAFATWIETDARTPHLAFDSDSKKHGQAKLDGVNRILAAPITLAGHEDDLAITISYVDSSGEILEADVIINTRHAFDMDASPSCGGYDLRSIVTHEAGHFFGLGEDREDKQAAMFFKTSKCEINKRMLAPSDVAAIDFLYDQAIDDEEVATAGCSMAATRGAGSWGWVVLAGLGMVALRRR